MPVVTCTITADADDGHDTQAGVWNDRTDEGYPAGEFFVVHYEPSIPDVVEGACRFLGASFTANAVPQGATINSATLTINISNASSIHPTDSVLRIYGDNVDNSGALGSGHRPRSGWTNTTAFTDVIGIVTGDVGINVATIIQEITSRAGFGGNYAFRFQPNGADNYWDINIRDFDADTAATKPRLSIDYTAAGGSGGTRRFLLLLGCG